MHYKKIYKRDVSQNITCDELAELEETISMILTSSEGSDLRSYPLIPLVVLKKEKLPY